MLEQQPLEISPEENAATRCQEADLNLEILPLATRFDLMQQRCDYHARILNEEYIELTQERRPVGERIINLDQRNLLFYASQSLKNQIIALTLTELGLREPNATDTISNLSPRRFSAAISEKEVGMRSSGYGNDLELWVDGEWKNRRSHDSLKNNIIETIAELKGEEAVGGVFAYDLSDENQEKVDQMLGEYIRTKRIGEDEKGEPTKEYIFYLGNQIAKRIGSEVSDNTWVFNGTAKDMSSVAIQNREEGDWRYVSIQGGGLDIRFSAYRPYARDIFYIHGEIPSDAKDILYGVVPDIEDYSFDRKFKRFGITN